VLARGYNFQPIAIIGPTARAVDVIIHSIRFMATVGKIGVCPRGSTDFLAIPILFIAKPNSKNLIQGQSPISSSYPLTIISGYRNNSTF
jgi:hypothetical protein